MKHTTTVTFTRPVDAVAVLESAVNAFIVVNYMMWALMIPGEFRYPAERKDIRTAYTSFNAWAASGGAQHVDWYEDEADEDMLY